MKFDSRGFIEMEQAPYPGSIGDSCAETFRYFNLCATVGRIRGSEVPDITRAHVLNLFNQIRTDNGFLRHPTAPEGWREDDFSFDQCLPLLLALESWGLDAEHSAVVQSLVKAKYRTGNGDLVPPTLWSATRSGLLGGLPVLLQGLAMKHLPYRWNDERMRLEKQSQSSADYINWVHLIFRFERVGHNWTTRRAKSLFSASEILFKIRHYYAPEARAFVLPLYAEAVEHIFKK